MAQQTLMMEYYGAASVDCSIMSTDQKSISQCILVILWDQSRPGRDCTQMPLMGLINGISAIVLNLY